MSIRVLVWGMALLLLSGCAVRSDQRADIDYVRGWLLQDKEGFRFRACHQDSWQALQPLPRQVEREYQQLTRSAIPIYVEALVQEDQATSRLRLTQLRLMARDAQGCHEHLSGVLMRLQGEQPSAWQLDISEARISLSMPGHLRTLIFPYQRATREGSDWVWDSEIKVRRGQTHRMQARVRSAGCHLGNQFHGLEAEVWLDNRLLSAGCARRGDLQRLMLSSRYGLPAEMEMRRLDVRLHPEGGLIWEEDYLTGQPLIHSEGRWQLLPNGSLLLAVDQAGSGMREEALLFRPLRGGRWQLQGFHPSYGRELVLEPQGRPLPWRGGNLPVP